MKRKAIISKRNDIILLSKIRKPLVSKVNVVININEKVEIFKAKKRFFGFGNSYGEHTISEVKNYTKYYSTFRVPTTRRKKK